MSIKAMTRVFDCSQAKANSRVLMLTIADFANDSGHAWPSLATLAKKSLMSRRNVIYVLKELEKAGELRIRRNEGRRGCNIYQILVGRTAEEIAADSENRDDPDDDATGANFAPPDPPPPPEQGAFAGEKSAPPASDRVNGRSGAKSAPPGSASSARGGAKSCTPGVQPVAPEPSLDPSVDPSKKSTATVLLDSLQAADDLGDTDRLVELHAALAASPDWSHIPPGELGLLNVITLAEHCLRKSTVEGRGSRGKRSRGTRIRNPVGVFIARLNNGDFDLTDAEEQSARARLRRGRRLRVQGPATREGPHSITEILAASNLGKLP